MNHLETRTSKQPDQTHEVFVSLEITRDQLLKLAKTMTMSSLGDMRCIKEISSAMAGGEDAENMHYFPLCISSLLPPKAFYWKYDHFQLPSSYQSSNAKRFAARYRVNRRHPHPNEDVGHPSAFLFFSYSFPFLSCYFTAGALSSYLR